MKRISPFRTASEPVAIEKQFIPLIGGNMDANPRLLFDFEFQAVGADKRGTFEAGSRNPVGGPLPSKNKAFRFGKAGRFRQKCAGG